MNGKNTAPVDSGPREANEYRYSHALKDHTHKYLWPVVEKPLISELRKSNSRPRVFDLGCGNGSFMAHLEEIGFDVAGVDASKSGVQQAKAAWPELKVEVGSAYDDLASQYGRFAIVVSLEVVEHVYSPRDFAKTLFNLVEPGGIAVVSTPYHGYFKNLALAITGKLDAHFAPLWDHGHIKFWSVKSLSELLKESGFVDLNFLFAGRTRLMAKSMVAVAKRPR